MSDARKYRILRQLGTGLSGVVYLSETDSRTVAVRQFRPRFSPDSAEGQADRHSFLAAARRAATLEHPQIASVLDVIDEDGGAFVATEYVNGETLESCLANERFSAEKAILLLRGIAYILDYAHQKGVPHGDLKPSNVFVRPDQGIAVADFAISPRARATHQPFPPEWKHFYLSPEHLLAPETISRWSDQYSLGAIAYHLLTGRPPFAADAHDLKSAVLSGELTPPSSIQPGLSQSTDRALLKALERDPQRRYASNALFIDRLEAAIAFDDVSQRSKKRSRTILFAGAGTAMLALFAITLFLMRSGKNPHETSHQLSPPSSSTLLRPIPATKPTPAPAPIAIRAQPVKTSDRQPHKTNDDAARSPRTDLVAARAPSPISTPTQRPAPLPDGRRFSDQMPVLPPAKAVEIAVFSRTVRIDPDSSFGYRDSTLGEMGYGDLKAVVQADGPAPKGKLTLEWCLDEICQGAKPVSANRPVEYNNEPTTGTYKIILRANSKPVKTFVFRIIP